MPDLSDALARARSARLLLALWSLLAGLLLLAQQVRNIPDPWLSVVVLFIALPLTALLFWRRRVRRLAFRRVWLKASSRYQPHVRGGVLMLCVQFIIAVLLSTLLVLGLARELPAALWLALLVMVPLWLLTHEFISRRVAVHVQTPFARLVTDRLQILAHGLCLLVLLSAWSLYQPVPNLSEASIEQAILHYAAQSTASSSLLQAGLDAVAALDALHQWLVQNLLGEQLHIAWRLLAWLLVLAREWLMIWPLLLLVQALHVIVEGDQWRLIWEDPDVHTR